MFGDSAGSVAIIFGLLLPCLLGFAALAIEVGYWYSEKNKLQIAADTAAYSALVAYGIDDNLDKAIAVGVAQARASGFSGTDAEIEILIPSQDAALGPNSSRANLVVNTKLFLSSLFLNTGTIDIGVNAFATMDAVGTPAPCMLALKPNQSRSIVMAASVKTNMNCVVATNSASNDAIWVEGSASLTATCAKTPGTIGTNGGAWVSLTDCPGGYARETSTDPLSSTPFWGSPAIPDTGFFADQAISQGRYGVGMPGGNILKPGKYGKQVEIDGTVTLLPGIYYFTAGFRAAPGSRITGDGVTIYLDQSRVLDIAQNVAWDLKAPTSGPTEGMAIMGDPSRTGGSVRLIGILGNVEGGVYFPNQTLLTESGPNLSTARCTRLVASTIDIRGGGTVNNDCSGSTGGAGGGNGRVRLAKGSA
ncbi:hypothetical protein ASD83_14420 [Devosia sp. Root685]|uniref:pilus assembly protein TadG-related protein n=1 Tax=Devosia sp. Root685 TaxID=1736587 RepID=UPI0006F711F4|nr:pilus assembly protein TadG-related protein [Devosia sp. Root685]KRA98226.1 hypothetical protein ASD83_14420 [Devosia sp. Root685]